MSTFARTMTIICAVGTGAVGGVFFAFSTFVMSGLGKLPPEQGAAAMQSINRQAPTPLFMLLLFGTGATCLVLAISALADLGRPGAVYQLVGCALYLLGVIVLTVTYHVPRNDMLAALDPASAEGMAYWTTYLTDWTRMNHVRTLAPLAAAALLTTALANTPS